MIPVSRVSHATFETPDLERQIEYYSRVMGLSLLSKSAKHVIFGGPAGQEVISFVAGDTNKCVSLTFQTHPNVDFSAIAKQLEKNGLASQKRSDITPFIREAMAFTDPKGTQIELFSEHGPTPIPRLTSGISPLKLGHVAFSVPSAKLITDFYVETLGFRVSDWIEDLFAFLRCGPDHHTVNFLNGADTFMHHIAYELKDWAHLLTACEVLGREKQPIIWGPGRHRVRAQHLCLLPRPR